MHNVLILNYHALATGDRSETGVEKGLSVRPEDFSAQMALIKKLGIPVVSLEEVVENNYKRRRWHRHVLAITCTHTFLTNNDTVLPLLEHYGFPATVFITTRNQDHAECWAQWRQIAAAGFSLGSHTVSHVNLTKLPESQLHEELMASKTIMETETGQDIRFLAAPLGAYDRRVMRVARETGYEALLTNKVGVNRFNADPFQLRRWTVTANTGLKEFKRMICRDKKEMVTQKVKAQALKNGSKLRPKSLFGKLKGLFRGMRV